MNGLLQVLIKKVIAKYQPKVIGVFGDAEKDLISHAVYGVLDYKFKNEVRKSVDNYGDAPSILWSTVLGLPASSSTWNFIKRALSLWFFRQDYPKYIVLSYPVNAPGKIEGFLNLVKPTISILGAITDRNVEYFGSLEEELAEKGKIAGALCPDNYLMLGIDNELVLSLVEKSQCNVITYGFSDKAKLQAKDLVVWKNKEQVETDEKFLGMAFKVIYEGKSIPFSLSGICGAEPARSLLPAIGVGLSLGISLEEMAEFFKNKFRPLPGRLNLIPSIKKTLIVDDSYDASAYSMMLALDLLSLLKIETPREKFAILGSVSNAGSTSEDIHREIGAKLASLKIDYLIAVTEKARDIIRGARDAGMPEDRCYYFATVEEAGKFVQNRLEKGDLMLVSGSYQLRMEKIVKELMASPMAAEMLLCKK